MVNDRFSTYNHQLLELQQQLIKQWHRDKDGAIAGRRCNLAGVRSTHQLVVELSCQHGGVMPSLMAAP
jgi:hypothetical protein